MVLGASADWRGSSGLRLAYVNEERGSAISRLAPPNDASPRHRQRRLREAPTAVAAAAAAAAATHTRTRQEGSVLHTLYTTYVQGSLVGGGHDLRFSVCLSSLTRLSVSFALLSSVLFAFFLLAFFFFLPFFTSPCVPFSLGHSFLRSLSERYAISVCESNFFPRGKETFVYAFSFSLYFRCACVLLWSSFPLIFRCLSLALTPSCLLFRRSFCVSPADFCSLLSLKRTHAHTEDLGQFCLSPLLPSSLSCSFFLQAETPRWWWWSLPVVHW